MNTNETALMKGSDAGLLTFEWNHTQSSYLVGKLGQAQPFK
jgi:hypothetical protein